MQAGHHDEAEEVGHLDMRRMPVRDPMRPMLRLRLGHQGSLRLLRKHRQLLNNFVNRWYQNVSKLEI